MYANVHFAWAIDYYEAGANSEWLLPNRLYEGPLHGAVPFALRRTEAGRWLDQRGCGILFGDAVEEELVKFLSKLDMPAYTQAKQALARIPYSDLVDGPEACAKFVAVLAAL